MKHVFSYFLFQKQPEEGLSAKRRAAFWLWNALLLAGACLMLGLLSLVLAPGPYGWELFADYFRRPALVVLNLLPPVVLCALLYALTGRAWLAYLITALPVLGLAFGNYYKLSFRDDPVIASDLLILGEARQMAGKYELFLSTKLIAVLVCAAAGLIVLALFARARPRRRLRAGIAAGALAICLVLTPVYGSDGIYTANANTHKDNDNQWSSTQQYISRGLLYPFLHSVKAALPNPPDGYSEREAARLLEQYEDEDIPDGQKVNIVGVMLEAFSDFSVFDQIEFTRDVYADYHALEAESYSGRLLTNIFAGGTVNTERAFLTGIAADDYNCRTNYSSYAWYLKGQGYQTSGDHPSYEWFYNRSNVNSYLGFDQYRFIENFYQYFPPDDMTWDYTFFPQLTDSVLKQAEGDAPVFSFSVSYQGHGPYGDYECWWGEVEDYIANYDLDDASRYILSNYLGSVMNTQAHLMTMVDAFRSSDEPIVLVVFGDHKPWLGNGNSVYDALGIDLSDSTEEGFYNYWSTSYLIWANGAAKAALGTDLAGQGPDISPCFLMNLLFDRLGWKGDAYMQAVDECWREVPVIHNQGVCFDVEGRMLDELSPRQEELVRRFQCLGYYRARHFAYETAGQP